MVIYHFQKQTNISDHDSYTIEEAGLIAADESTEDGSPQPTDHLQPEEIAVDIKGAVLDPGVYTLDASARVYDVIELAGGFAKHADEKQINLAERVQDEMLIYVPAEGEIIPVQSQGSNEAAKDSGVRVNAATAEELQTLNGIGPQKAEAIINYIQENGPFSDANELLQVSGIGEKTLEKFKDDVIIP